LSRLRKNPHRRLRRVHWFVGCIIQDLQEGEVVAMKGAVTITCDISTTGKRIGNRFRDMSFWHYLGTTGDERTWHEWAEERPENWVVESYPWLEEVQLFIATGGSYVGYPGTPLDEEKCEFDRDLFVDPSDGKTLDDYDFRPLVRACRNILRQGLKPCLKLHAVPIKYSAEPRIGWFRVNVSPPADYEVYYEYLKACVRALADELGLEEVRSWRWFVMTEIENKDWWLAPDGSAETTRTEFLKMYDYSVAALEDVLGAEHVKVGTHSMSLHDGLWDDREVLDHCVKGTNHKRGTAGTRLDFFAISYYDNTPGDPGDLSRMSYAVSQIRHRAAELGLARLPIEVSEGGLCYGSDGKWLWHGLCLGGAYDVSWTALSFKKIIDHDIELWSRWPSTRTGGIFKGIQTGTTNLLRLICRMRDDSLAGITVNAAAPRDGSGIIDGIAGYNASANTAHVLVFHHHKDFSTDCPDETVELSLDGVQPASGDTVTVRKWIIDEDHNDFWKQWVADRTACGITDDDYEYSRDQIYVQHALKRQEHIDFWHSRASAYEALSALTVESETNVMPTQNAVTLEDTLRPHSVVFYEIMNVQSVMR